MRTWLSLALALVAGSALGWLVSKRRGSADAQSASRSSYTAIVVMGPSGCGKSTLARALAAQTGRLFVEGDDHHPPENIAKLASGVPLTDEDRSHSSTALAERSWNPVAPPRSAVRRCASAIANGYDRTQGRSCSCGSTCPSKSCGDGCGRDPTISCPRRSWPINSRRSSPPLRRRISLGSTAACLFRSSCRRSCARPAGIPGEGSRPDRTSTIPHR